MDDIQHTTLFKVLIMTKQETINTLRGMNIRQDIINTLSKRDVIIIKDEVIIGRDENFKTTPCMFRIEDSIEWEEVESGDRLRHIFF